MNWYREDLLESYNSSKNRGDLKNPDFKVKNYNPSCGDLINLSGIIKNNTIKDIKFTGEGCVISLATADKLISFIINKDLNKILNFSKTDILDLVKIELGPTRLKCALLPLEAIKKGIESYLDSNVKSNHAKSLGANL